MKGKEAADQAAGTQSDWDDTLLIRIARVAYGSAVKWKREIKTEETNEIQTGSAETEEGEKVRYCSRVLACTRCGTEQETKEKQLKVKARFRAIDCKKCGKQERVHSNICRCNIIWHHCPLHRVDPPQHNLGRIKKKLATGTKKKE